MLFKCNMNGRKMCFCLGVLARETAFNLNCGGQKKSLLLDNVCNIKEKKKACRHWLGGICDNM